MYQPYIIVFAGPNNQNNIKSTTEVKIKQYILFEINKSKYNFDQKYLHQIIDLLFVTDDEVIYSDYFNNLPLKDLVLLKSLHSNFNKHSINFVKIVYDAHYNTIMSFIRVREEVNKTKQTNLTGLLNNLVQVYKYDDFLFFYLLFGFYNIASNKDVHMKCEFIYSYVEVIDNIFSKYSLKLNKDENNFSSFNTYRYLFRNFNPLGSMIFDSRSCDVINKKQTNNDFIEPLKTNKVPSARAIKIDRIKKKKEKVQSEYLLKSNSCKALHIVASHVVNIMMFVLSDKEFGVRKKKIKTSHIDKSKSTNAFKKLVPIQMYLLLFDKHIFKKSQNPIENLRINTVSYDYKDSNFFIKNKILINVYNSRSFIKFNQNNPFCAISNTIDYINVERSFIRVLEKVNNKPFYIDEDVMNNFIRYFSTEKAFKTVIGYSFSTLHNITQDKSIYYTNTNTKENVFILKDLNLRDEYTLDIAIENIEKIINRFKSFTYKEVIGDSDFIDNVCLNNCRADYLTTIKTLDTIEYLNTLLVTLNEIKFYLRGMSYIVNLYQKYSIFGVFQNTCTDFRGRLYRLGNITTLGSRKCRSLLCTTHTTKKADINIHKNRLLEKLNYIPDKRFQSPLDEFKNVQEFESLIECFVHKFNPTSSLYYDIRDLFSKLRKLDHSYIFMIDDYSEKDKNSISFLNVFISFMYEFYKSKVGLHNTHYIDIINYLWVFLLKLNTPVLSFDSFYNSFFEVGVDFLYYNLLYSLYNNILYNTYISIDLPRDSRFQGLTLLGLLYGFKDADAYNKFNIVANTDCVIYDPYMSLNTILHNNIYKVIDNKDDLFELTRRKTSSKDEFSSRSLKQTLTDFFEILPTGLPRSFLKSLYMTRIYGSTLHS
jgi:hypothetical protein